MSKPAIPENLGTTGLATWNSLVGKYQFRPDEVVVVTRICRALDRIDEMTDELDGQILSTGSTGAVVVHPLIPEIRAHESMVSSLLKQLKLPDDAAKSGESPRSTQARKAAQSRWAVAHGAAS